MPSTIIPTLRYDDAGRAVEFLCEAFGFRQHAVHEGEDGRIEHAELTLGEGMFMIGSRGDGEYDRRITTVAEVGKPIMTAYVVIDDVATHAKRAQTAGAKVVTPVEGRDYGGSEYQCLDPEGNLWTFGSYDPWTAN